MKSQEIVSFRHKDSLETLPRDRRTAKDALLSSRSKALFNAVVIPIVIVLVFLSIGVGIVFYFNHLDTTNRHDHLTTLCHERSRALAKGLTGELKILRSYASLFRASPQSVTDGMFKNLWPDVTQDSSGTSNMAFAPVVRHADRAAFEATHFPIVHFNSTTRTFFPAPDFDHYLPILYRAKDEAIKLGYDMIQTMHNRSLARWTSTSYNGTTNHITPTMPFFNEEPNFSITLPVFYNGVRNESFLVGLVVSYLPLENWVAVAMNSLQSVPISLNITGRSHGQPATLYTHNPMTIDDGPATTIASFAIDRPFNVTCMLSASYDATPFWTLSLWMAMFVLIGLLTGCMVRMYFTRMALVKRRVVHAIKEETAARKKADLALQDARKANERTSNFLSFVCHELRNPLNSVVHMTEWIAETSMCKFQRDCLQTSRESTNLMISIVNDVLDLADFEEDRIEIERVPFDLSKVLSSLVRGSKPSDQVKLQLSLGSLPMKLWGDPTRIQQVVGNLIRTAIKFTSIGEINVSVRVSPESWRPPASPQNSSPKGSSMSPLPARPSQNISEVEMAEFAPRAAFSNKKSSASSSPSSSSPSPSVSATSGSPSSASPLLGPSLGDAAPRSSSSSSSRRVETLPDIMSPTAPRRPLSARAEAAPHCKPSPLLSPRHHVIGIHEPASPLAHSPSPSSPPLTSAESAASAARYQHQLRSNRSNNERSDRSRPNSRNPSPSRAERDADSDEANATDENGNSVRLQRIAIHFSVADTGIGIPEASLPHLFTPYSDSMVSNTREHGQFTAVGLAIVKNLVEKMGGQIAVTSAPGDGSTFEFTLWLWAEVNARYYVGEQIITHSSDEFKWAMRQFQSTDANLSDSDADSDTDSDFELESKPALAVSVSDSDHHHSPAKSSIRRPFARDASQLRRRRCPLCDGKCGGRPRPLVNTKFPEPRTDEHVHFATSATHAQLSSSSSSYDNSIIDLLTPKASQIPMQSYSGYAGQLHFSSALSVESQSDCIFSDGPFVPVSDFSSARMSSSPLLSPSHAPSSPAPLSSPNPSLWSKPTPGRVVLSPIRSRSPAPLDPPPVSSWPPALSRSPDQFDPLPLDITPRHLVLSPDTTPPTPVNTAPNEHVEPAFHVEPSGSEAHLDVLESKHGADNGPGSIVDQVLSQPSSTCQLERSVSAPDPSGNQQSRRGSGGAALVSQSLPSTPTTASVSGSVLPPVSSGAAVSLPSAPSVTASSAVGSADASAAPSIKFNGPAVSASAFASAPSSLPFLSPSSSPLSSPSASPSSTSSSQASPKSAPFNPSAHTILVVEDNVINQKIVKRLLGSAGYSICIANHGQEAVDIVESKSPDLFSAILMDLEMPVLNGFLATMQLRQRGYTMPIIAVTANYLAKDRIKCAEIGMCDFVTKPIQAKKLKDALQQALRASESSEASP